MLGRKDSSSIDEANSNKEVKTLLLSNWHQVEKRKACSKNQNEISYEVRL